ncbi:NEDD8-activating enzyme E1 catalytic subunit [Neolecta irregularis DAH-3]|uniref:NEDD8-activating enzyme E1 catalytic subunit n=1 Tax=Neolecta irregularis (strain DAH-3) TaxID=1198029 RepID=A0A1U7LIU3_NEOID|nr:NEDD8-activating enzyme E1 catalytic subunit [Neolecta irregularis DAH-3]|eukprot:OLL22580.1 NEDD8-activating enzyme E1 catalytic subunit [Neolecta irregularis DAH-3]
MLVIGAGGLGCEILKNLALSGFKDIHVIDMDTIDISNLNRQFLFRQTDVGQSKAFTAAKFIMERVSGVTVTPHYCKIQDKSDEFYLEFMVIVCGLDSVEARRWINSKLFELLECGGVECLKPLIDGGTEGFKGQSRVIIPGESSCYECSLDMLTPPTTFPICTIANTPRLPEHCIEWASVLEWPRVRKGETLNGDNPEHIEFLYTLARNRAAEYQITGVTVSLTQGVIKHIIPAIASTNAIIAASCCNEALKLVGSLNPYLDNYMMYMADHGVYTYTFSHEKKEDCPVCGTEPVTSVVDRETTLEEWIQSWPHVQVKAPALSTRTSKLYYSAPPQLHEFTRHNLEKRMCDLVEENDVVFVTSPSINFQLRLRVCFK